MFIGKQVILKNNCSAKKKAKQASKTLRGLRSKHPKNAFPGHLNVNSLRNKFKSLNEPIKDTFDIFLVSDSKLDSSFPKSQFLIPGYRIFRKDRNNNGGEYFSKLMNTYLLKSPKANNYEEIYKS